MECLTDEHPSMQDTAGRRNRREGLPALLINAPTTGPDYAACFYHRSNAAYGSKMPRDGLRPGRHGLSNRFTDQLNACGGPKRDCSLNTYVDREPFCEGRKDYMLKLAS